MFAIAATRVWMVCPGCTLWRRRMLRERQKFMVVAARGLAAALALTIALVAVEHSARAAENRPAPILSKTREEISFSIQLPPKAGQQPVCTYAMERLRRNGKVVKAAPTMKLDAGTGKFSWTPTESQAELSHPFG